LGPVLFLLYINDLTTFIKDVKIIIYADDISILVTDKSEEHLNIKVTKVMKQLEEWFDKNQLILNIHKSSVISIHTRQCYSFVKPKTMYNNMEFSYCSQLKFLGSYITEHLDWKSHIQDLLFNLSRIYYIIKSLKDTVSLQTIKTIYFAHFQARLQYGILFWGHDSDCTKLFRLQKKVIQLISGMKRFESCRYVLRLLTF
jgi:hypothetical protein